LGAVTGLGVFGVQEMKRDPDAPLYRSVAENLFMQVISGTQVKGRYQIIILDTHYSSTQEVIKKVDITVDICYPFSQIQMT